MYQFIVNPSAGAGRGYRIWKRLEHQLEMNSQEYRVFFTEHQGDAAEIARALTAEKDEAKVIVIVGGEGTYNEVLNGVSFRGLLTFGYVPAGFRNALSKGFQSSGRWTVRRGGSFTRNITGCWTMALSRSETRKIGRASCRERV